MKQLLVLLLALCAAAQAQPKAGPVEIMRSAEIKAGMQGVAWTVFQGATPEAIPVEIIGLWKNSWGPGQDVILAKLGGKAARTNVAGGMSGSPVYVDGKLIGAIALRISVFSPDAICGITPIEHMLEINSLDTTRPAGSRAPQESAAAAPARVSAGGYELVPIETPLTLSGFHPATLREFRPFFDAMGVTAVQGGATGALAGPEPAAGWQDALQPGQAVAGVLASGDLSVTGLGTVTYNDGKRILAFGHSFFNLGPLDMPMSAGEILMVLSSQFQPNKIANATEIVGALRQDRHSGIMGELGRKAEMIPVELAVRSLDSNGQQLQRKDFRFHIFVQQKWTPFLVMLTLFNTLQGLNEYAEEITYRLSGQVEMAAPGQRLALNTMVAPGEAPMPAPMQLASWAADRVNRLFLNTNETPRLRAVNATIDLLPQRLTAAIESAYLDSAEAAAGGELSGRVFLKPFRGARMLRQFKIQLPAGLPRGEHRLLISDADALNRMQTMAGLFNRTLDVGQTVSLLNQERSNTRVYVSLIEARPTVYYDEKALENLPSSVANVLQSARSANRPLLMAPESATEKAAFPVGLVVSGNTQLRFTVK